MFDTSFVDRAMLPEPPTQQELTDAETLRPGDYEIYSENLLLMLQEGKEVMTKMGISSMLHSGDTLVAVYTAGGDLVSAVLGTYLHSVTGQVPIKFVIDQFTSDESVGVREGDVFYTNEALMGGIHNPDQFAFMPVFHDDELIAWVVSGAHQSETGGSEPGGEITQAHTRHDEGMKLTPIKIGESYRLRNDLLMMMENFISRAPRMQITDVKARVAACDRVRVRLQDLADRRGSGLLRGLFRRMIQQTSIGVKRRIEAWPDGVYRHNVFMDTTGHEAGLLRTSVTVTVEGDSLTIDFEGSSPEHTGSYNAFTNVIRGHCAVNLYQFPFHDFPISSGMLEHIDIRVPKGSFLHADGEAAISCSPLVGALVFPLLGVTLSKAMFAAGERETVCGFCSSSASAVMVAGKNQHGVRVTDFMGYPLNAYGLAARPDKDGVDVFGFPHGPWGKAPDVEDIESEFPLLHVYQKQQRDTCGFGKQRGGVGAAICYAVHQVPRLAFTSSQKESKFPAHNGVFGGYSMSVLPGVRVVEAELLRADAGGRGRPADRRLRPRVRLQRAARRGDRRASDSGDPGGRGGRSAGGEHAGKRRLRRRARARSRGGDRGPAGGRDQRLDRGNVFHVAYDAEALLLDAEATERLRAEQRARRLEHGKPYAEFVAEWAAEAPASAGAQVLRHVADAKPNRQVMRI